MIAPYFTPQKYMAVYKILIEKEAEFDRYAQILSYICFRLIKESQTKSDVKVRFMEERGGKQNAVFSLPREDNVKICEGIENISNLLLHS